MDWKNIGFRYRQTDYRYVANYKDGKWQEGKLTQDANVTINECAGILQYCQEVFEGLKVYTTKDHKIVAFRPDQNAERMMDSAAWLQMPPFPKEEFLNALDQLVRANKNWVPPYGSDASLYIRPYMFASSPVIGVKPAEEYIFRMICMPVGPYFQGGIKPIKLCVSKYDRAAPKGSGHIKAGLNYAMSMRAHTEAYENGFDENMFLDPQTRTKVEETGGANILFVTKDGELVTPKSHSILPSITRRSMVEVAREYLGMKVTEREIALDEVKDFAECGLVGTAAVLSPVGQVVGTDGKIVFDGDMEKPGEVMLKLYNTLRGMQLGEIEAPKGWIRVIDEQ